MNSKSEIYNWDRLIHGLEEFQLLAKDISDLLSEKAILLLKGDLGTGKTTFVRALCQYRGIQQVASPTFALHHEYKNHEQVIHHLDLYRLQNEDELETTGFWDLFSQTNGLIIVEWPERIHIQHLPYDWSLYEVRIEKVSDSTRKIFFQKIR